MMKIGFYCVVAILFSAVTAFSQVKNLPSVPDLSGPDWVLVGTNNVSQPVMGTDGKPLFSLSITYKSYFSREGNHRADVLVLNDKAVVMVYGSDLDNPESSRTAIFTDKWYPAKNSGQTLDISVVGNFNTGRAQVTFTLDTDEGVKELVVNDVPMVK